MRAVHGLNEERRSSEGVGLLVGVHWWFACPAHFFTKISLITFLCLKSAHAVYTESFITVLTSVSSITVLTDVSTIRVKSVS